MANSLLSKASSAVAACARRVSRATRRLLRARRGRLHRDRRQLVPADDHNHEPPRAAGVGEAEGEDGLWRRTILMGERCKPLDFPGVIHYDSFGRRLSAPPLARSGRAALLCRSVFDVDEAAAVAPRQAVAKRA
ncbi:hypothetical protein QOZ80_1AG0023730 [Eleusine coracana subsp. coracana]|nr:hypothetical protein QOZ80_1AG0023730 [Eleusine coracana subsp. coracana]